MTTQPNRDIVDFSKSNNPKPPLLLVLYSSFIDHGNYVCQLINSNHIGSVNFNDPPRNLFSCREKICRCFPACMSSFDIRNISLGRGEKCDPVPRQPRHCLGDKLRHRLTVPYSTRGQTKYPVAGTNCLVRVCTSAHSCVRQRH